MPKSTQTNRMQFKQKRNQQSHWSFKWPKILYPKRKSKMKSRMSQKKRQLKHQLTESTLLRRLCRRKRIQLLTQSSFQTPKKRSSILLSWRWSRRGRKRRHSGQQRPNKNSLHKHNLCKFPNRSRLNKQSYLRKRSRANLRRKRLKVNHKTIKSSKITLLRWLGG